MINETKPCAAQGPGLPEKLTGELACILENCGPPDKQNPQALAALIEGYQPTWDKLRAALAHPVSAQGPGMREALEPFARYYDDIERNGYIDGIFNLIARQDGNVIGHAGIQLKHLKEARAALAHPVAVEQPCECGFSQEVCSTNPCMRKKVHLAGLTPGSKWPQGAPIHPSVTVEQPTSPAVDGEALRYATRLLEHFVAEHFPHNPDWKPLPDLVGVLTQLDNAITIARDYKQKLAALTSRVSAPVAGGPDVNDRLRSGEIVTWTKDGPEPKSPDTRVREALQKADCLLDSLRVFDDNSVRLKIKESLASIPQQEAVEPTTEIHSSDGGVESRNARSVSLANGSQSSGSTLGLAEIAGVAPSPSETAPALDPATVWESLKQVCGANQDKSQIKSLVQVRERDVHEAISAIAGSVTSTARTGIFSSLTPKQQKAALEYDGPEDIGPVPHTVRGDIDGYCTCGRHKDNQCDQCRSFSQTSLAEEGLCTGGFDPGWDECPKCGATSDDECRVPSNVRAEK